MNALNNPINLPSNRDRIAHYRIVRKLGQGGMSIVYEGFDEKLKRPVALKILHPFLVATAEHRTRFFREAEAVARLTHPNIVQIFDVSNSDAKDEELYIVTELLLGKTLTDFLKDISLIEAPELAAMMVWQIASALEHAHQNGIIHRDIKPENIMIVRDGQIKLLDFGIASLGNDESITQVGTLLGSLRHISPEVVKGQKATIASDIFSLTTVFYWMLTQQMPFVAASPHALLKAIVEHKHTQVQCLSPFILDELAFVVDKGMSKDPTLRFPSALHMCEAIESALAFMGIAIDIKGMQAVLKNPLERLPDFKKQIDQQVKKQVAIARQENNETALIALMCRLEANAGIFASKNEAQTSGKPRRIYAKSFFIISTIATIIAFPSDRNQRVKINDSSPLRASLVNEIPIQEERLEPKELATNSSSMVSDDEQEKKIPKEDLVLPRSAHEPKTSPEKISLQAVQIIVWPFADIAVDGKIIAHNKKSALLMLKPGKHLITFTHPYAALVEKTIDIDQVSADALNVSVSLEKTKPAYLTVEANIDVDVAVAGNFRGFVKKNRAKPIVIPMPDKSYADTKEVIISHDGYKPFITEAEFIAGQVKVMEVKLKAIGATSHTNSRN